MMKSFNRREMITAGAASLLGTGLLCREVQGREITTQNFDSWIYTKIDPVKAAGLAYEIYPEGSCMYAVIRALLTTVADALQTIYPMAATVMMQFPFHMLGYGHGGIGGTGSACGAFNGGAAVTGLFVKDATRRDMMIQELASYYENMELPTFKPKDDPFPSMEKSVSESLLCHVSSGRWRAVANANMLSPRRVDRCRRLAADITTKTAELLNRQHTDTTCAIVGLTQPTATCVDCHGPKGTQADSIGTMNCASCHEHDEKHSNLYFNLKK